MFLLDRLPGPPVLAQLPGRWCCPSYPAASASPPPVPAWLPGRQCQPGYLASAVYPHKDPEGAVYPRKDLEGDCLARANQYPLLVTWLLVPAWLPGRQCRPGYPAVGASPGIQLVPFIHTGIQRVLITHTRIKRATA